MKVKQKLLFIIEFFLYVFCAFSQNTEINLPSLEPLFNINEFSDDLDGNELFELSLLFSGIEKDSDSWKNNIQNFNNLKKSIFQTEFNKLKDTEKAELLLKKLYESTLTKYKSKQTKTSVIFDNGTYNCVSSAVLYLCLAKLCNLNVVGVKVPVHAFCSLYYTEDEQNEIKVDIETTNPYGYNPGRKEVLKQSENSTSYFYIPKKNYSNRKNVSDKVFVGLIAGNIIAEEITKKTDYTYLIPLEIAHYELVMNENSADLDDVRSELDSTVNNYVNSVGLKNTYKVIPWLEKYIEKYGITKNIQLTYDTYFNNAIVSLSDWADIEFLNEFYNKYKKLCSENKLNQAETIVFEKTLDNKIKQMDEDSAISYLIEKKNSLNSKNRELYLYINNRLEYLIINKLNSYGKDSDSFYQCYIKAQEYFQIINDSVNLKRLVNNYKNNYLSCVHNEFAYAYNERNVEKAALILNEALEKFPDDKTLLRDKQLLMKILEQ